MKKLFVFLLLGLLAMIDLSQQSLIKADTQGPTDFGVDLAYGRRVVSTDTPDNNLNVYAVDANPNTRYASQQTDDAFFLVDLGSVEKVGKVVIDWEAAYASEYEIQMSLDGVDWITVANVTNTEQTKDEIVFPNWIETEFVKFQGVKRATGYGYSFYSFEVYGPKSLAEGSTVLEVSSNENETVLNKQNMTDNLASTRWASAAEDNQYFIIDLGQTMTFDQIKVRWEVSFARIYDIYACADQASAPARDDANWTKVWGTKAGLGEVDSVALLNAVSARYLKVELIQRETSEATKKTGRFPWESSFSIYSFEIFDWSGIQSVPLGSVMEYSYNAPAWTSASNLTLNPSGLLLAPNGYPIEADGVVTDMASIADGNIPGFESYATYNPAVIYDDVNHMFHMIYRAELPDNFRYYYMSYPGGKYPLGHMSSLAYAYSYDGVHFYRGLQNPIAWATTGDEAGGGLEDPRMFKIVNDPNRGGVTTYYITYTMYDNSTTREGIIYTQDFVTFTKVGRLAPDYDGAYKSGTFVTDPEGNAVKINDPRPGHTGEVYMIYMKDGGYTKLGFTTDVIHINAEDIVDVSTLGLGTNDIEDFTHGNESCMALTNIYGPDDEDIYLMYGGGSLSDANLQNEMPNVHGWFYALGVLKTTKSNPFELTHLRMDINEPTMYPTDTNKIDYGLFNKCMFADSMIRHDNTWYLYYGAGDMYVGLATARADFSAGAATYNFDTDTNILTASTLALNRKYGDDKTDYNIDFVMELHALDGTLLDTVTVNYSVPHFSHMDLGKYSTGLPVQADMDLSAYQGQMYYVTTYITNHDTGEIINHLSTYTVIQPVVNRTAK